VLPKSKDLLKDKEYVPIHLRAQKVIQSRESALETKREAQRRTQAEEAEREMQELEA